MGPAHLLDFLSSKRAWPIESIGRSSKRLRTVTIAIVILPSCLLFFLFWEFDRSDFFGSLYRNRFSVLSSLPSIRPNSNLLNRLIITLSLFFLFFLLFREFDLFQNNPKLYLFPSCLLFKSFGSQKHKSLSLFFTFSSNKSSLFKTPPSFILYVSFFPFPGEDKLALQNIALSGILPS